MKTKKHKVVLDTNIILSSISRKSPYNNILKYLFSGYYELVISNEILFEYEEKLTEIFSEELANSFIVALTSSLFVTKIDVYFDLNLIKDDKDDNKFVNCAFASNAHYLVTNDKHFNVLKEITFPRINLLTISEFVNVLQKK